MQGCKNGITDRQEENVSVYKTDREFVYSVVHFDKYGKLYLQDTLILTTSPKVFKEKYGQTSSSWTSKGKNRWQSYSGITENDTVVWIHPPRTGNYRKLELAPFPMIEYPIKIGNRWSWNLIVGGHYSVRGSAEWQRGTNESFDNDYQITKEKAFLTNFGKIDCYEINSICSNRFANTELTAFYSPKYGFVKLQYFTIDNERMIMELVSVKTLPSLAIFPFSKFSKN